MTEKEFIEQYVATNSNMIESCVEQGLEKESMIQALADKAKDSWRLLQKEIEEDTDDLVEYGKLRPNWIYSGTPEDKDSSLKKVIFCLKTTYLHVLSFRCALYIDETGDQKLHVSDKDARHAISYESESCSTMGKQEVGFDIQEHPLEIHHATQDEIALLHQMLASADMALYPKYDGLLRTKFGERIMNN